MHAPGNVVVTDKLKIAEEWLAALCLLPHQQHRMSGRQEQRKEKKGGGCTKKLSCCGGPPSKESLSVSTC